jgi:hypothetical protein
MEEYRDGILLIEMENSSNENCGLYVIFKNYICVIRLSISIFKIAGYLTYTPTPKVVV